MPLEGTGYENALSAWIEGSFCAASGDMGWNILFRREKMGDENKSNSSDRIGVGSGTAKVAPLCVAVVDLSKKLSKLQSLVKSSTSHTVKSSFDSVSSAFDSASLVLKTVFEC